MIPQWATAGVLTAPSSPLITSGYVPGNSLAAQHWNWLWGHITAELNNVLSGVGLSQLSTDDTQIRQAIGRVNSVVSTSGTVTTASQFLGNTLTQFANVSGSSNYVITAGAARPGVELIVEALTGSGVMIVNGSGSAFLGSGAIRLLWDGSAWCKIGGVTFSRVFTSGSAATWITPWKGHFKWTGVGGGGGGAGVNTGANLTAGQSGSGGATAIKTYYEAAGATFTYTVGALGGAGTTGAGSNGGDTTITDGITQIKGGGGLGGPSSLGGAGGIGGVAGGTATGGDVNIPGGNSDGAALTSGAANKNGAAGSSTMGSGGPGPCPGISAAAVGIAGSGYGAGGSGGINSGATTGTYGGGAGTAGIAVLEF